MNVSLTPDLERFVREKVDSGLYNSASEVVREALRLLVARDREELVARHRQEALYQVAEEPVATYGVQAEPPPSLEAAAARLRQALEMLQLSYSLMEQNLRREDPEASDAEIDQRLAAWKSEADWGEETPGYLERSPERLAKLRRAPD
jgi:antitoxin ParD1/3/4